MWFAQSIEPYLALLTNRDWLFVSRVEGFQLALVPFTFSSRWGSFAANVFDLAVGVLILLIPPLLLHSWGGRQLRDEYTVFDSPPLSFLTRRGVSSAWCPQGIMFWPCVMPYGYQHTVITWCLAWSIFGSSLFLPPTLPLIPPHLFDTTAFQFIPTPSSPFYPFYL